VDAAARRVTRPQPTARRLVAAAAGIAALAVSLAPTHLVPSAAAALAAVANPDTLSARHDRRATVAAPGVLANDLNLVGGTTAVLMSTTTHGTVSLASDGGYIYDPNPGYLGTDQFKYRDSGLLTNTTTVTITVTNAAPVAVDDSYSAVTGVTLTVPAPGVLGNDHDADGDSLTASLVDGSGNGSVDLASNGRLVFTSGGSFTGTRTITYRVWDGLAWSAIATITIVVRAPSATPAPTPVPTPVPTPTPSLAPTPAPTATLLPTLPPIPTLPPLPTLTPLPTLPPLPTLVPTPRGSDGPGPTQSPTANRSPGPSGSPDVPTGPAASADGGSGGGLAGGAGSIGAGPTIGPGGPGAANRPDGFAVGVADSGRVDGLGDIGVVGIGGLVEWAVPALVLSVPGLLLLLAVLAQAAGALLWVPVARRWLGGFGLRRRRAAERGSA